MSGDNQFTALAPAPITTGGVRGGRRAFGRDLAANTKLIYDVTSDGRLAQPWDTDR